MKIKVKGKDVQVGDGVVLADGKVLRVVKAHDIDGARGDIMLDLQNAGWAYVGPEQVITVDRIKGS